MKSLKEGYKKTEIGLIPYEWDLKRISDVCSVKGGKRLPKGYQLIDEKNQNPYIRVADMYNGGVSLDNIKYVPSEAIDSIKNYKISKDDLFISVAGTLGLVGKVPESLDGANLTENADKLCNIKINKEFLMRILQSELIQKIIELEKTSNAQPKLALTRIKEFLIPIPSEKEQEKIADILSTVDFQIDDTDKLIEKTKELKKGLMQRLLTKGIRHTEFKKTEVGEIPIEWEVKKIENLCNILDSQRKPLNSKERNMMKGSIPYYGANSIVDYIDSYIFDDEIILIAEDGGNFDEYKDKPIAFYVSGKCWVNNHAHVLSAKVRDMSKWIFYSLEHKNITEIIQGGTRAKLNQKDLRNILIPVGPMEEICEISNVLASVDCKIEEYKNKKVKLEELKTGLMQQLLTGKIRVV